ncbi:hypothetical protein DL239_19700, partial [Sedimentitalea sp. CY04]|nr:hypothetical protein [Sedimentitalea sp. CY04]
QSRPKPQRETEAGTHCPVIRTRENFEFFNNIGPKPTLIDFEANDCFEPALQFFCDVANGGFAEMVRLFAADLIEGSEQNSLDPCSRQR